MTLAARVKGLLLGRPLASAEDARERVGPLAGLPILGLDALASAAYGPEALATVLAPLGAAALAHMWKLMLAVVVLLVLLASSYAQTIEANPQGGGAYVVAKANLGQTWALVAAAALAVDYVLNVAVAISAGVGAVVSVAPTLLPWTLPLCLAILAVLTLVNLRGVRATGAWFMVPTYAFVGALATVITLGAIKAARAGGAPVPAAHLATAGPSMIGAASAWLLARAFAAGCTAMTGVEAVSDGVPIFRAPSAAGARRTLLGIVGILVALLLGVTLLCRAYGITATTPGAPGYESLLSQTVAAVMGRGAFYHAALASIVTVLALSANTSFADFPRVCRLLAADRYLPEAFLHRGRRLALSRGILVLAALSALLLVAFGGVTDALIPLFAVGAFLAFTISQLGMMAHWHRTRERGRRRTVARAQTALGAAATGATLIVILASKLAEGAWISVTLVAMMLGMFLAARRYYDRVARATATREPLDLRAERRVVVVVPIARWDTVAVKALKLAMTVSSETVAIQVITDDEELERLDARWPALVEEPARRAGREPPRLVVRRSEFRTARAPVLDLVSELTREDASRLVAVVVPELVERRWWHYSMHNYGGALLRATLVLKGGAQVVTIGAPWHLDDLRRERLLLRRRRGGSRSGK